MLDTGELEEDATSSQPDPAQGEDHVSEEEDEGQEPEE